MRARNQLRMWRLFELGRTPLRPCPNCGQLHPYLTQPTVSGVCRPLLFPPGTPGPALNGQEVEVGLVGPVEQLATEAGADYQHVAARVRESAIRCERCGERFDDLEVYRLHACELRYR